MQLPCNILENHALREVLVHVIARYIFLIG